MEGENIRGGLTLLGDTLYGSAYNGGTAGAGSIFRLKTDGSAFTVLKSFPVPTGSGYPTNVDGAHPNGMLVVQDGAVMGTAYSGGRSGMGTVFRMNIDGSAFQVLHGFTNNPDGWNPITLCSDGTTLYGATTHGGSLNSNPDLYGGTVFSLHPDGSGFTVLASYNSAQYPYVRNPNSLVYVNGALYGTTVYGIPDSASYGGGSVFKISLDGSGTFLRCLDTAYDTWIPASVVVSGDTIVGGTLVGGDANQGTLFTLKTDNTGFATVKSFLGVDGQNPYGGLAWDGHRLYGTTKSGGRVGLGAVFKTALDGSDYSVLSDIYPFNNRNINKFWPSPFNLQSGPASTLLLLGSQIYGTLNGGPTRFPNTAEPFGDVAFGLPNVGGDLTKLGVNNTILQGFESDGTNLFAPYTSGGSNSGILQVNTNGTSAVLFKFGTNSASDGRTPAARLTLVGSELFGTTAGGGANAAGTVFKIGVDGSGYQILHNFVADSEGYNPNTKLAYYEGQLYGTVTFGFGNNYGAVFRLSPDGTGFQVLRQFSPADGAAPSFPVVVSGGKIYGRTVWRGSNEAGTLYSMNIDGSGFRVLYHFPVSFQQASGDNSDSQMVLLGNALYGTTAAGGELGGGTIFKFDLLPTLNISLPVNLPVLTWANPSAILQSSPSLADPFTNVTGATSPYTNNVSASKTFFRLLLN